MPALLVTVILAFSLCSLASPVPSLNLNLTTLTKRELTTGALAGLAVGIAIAGLLLLGVVVFFIFHFRRRRHLAALNLERAILAGEKNKDGSDKVDKFAPESQKPAANLKRNKSVKDRLMGPLYRGSTIELPTRTQNGENPRDSAGPNANWTDIDGQPLVHKPWAESSPRPSFSSKRATRMMMMM
jgi:hypothetical protein